MPAGIVPLVSVDRLKVDHPVIHEQLRAQASRWGKTIRLCRFRLEEVMVSIVPVPGYPFTCPKCGRTSHNPNDAAHQYCGACHEFFGPFESPGKDGV